MSKKYVWPAALLVLVLISWLVLGANGSENPTILVSPQTGEFNVAVTTTGELRAQKSTEIVGPRGMREIGVHQVEITKLVPEGTIVEKGDFVASLDRSEISDRLQSVQLELDQVHSQIVQAQIDTSLTLSQARNEIVNLRYEMEQAQLKVKKSKYESPMVQKQRKISYKRAKRHYKQAKENYIKKKKKAEAKMAEVETKLQKKKNELQKIKSLMEEFTIYAPEDGMVVYERDWNGRKQVEGSTIRAWNPVVAELPDFSVMESVTYVNEVDIQQIEEGQRVDISLDAMPDKKLTGIVTDVANIGVQRPNSDAKVYEVVIEIQGTDSTLRPAMTTSNIIHVSSTSNALFLPLGTVHSQETMSFVYKQDGGEPVKQQIVLGKMNDNYVIIQAGIKSSDEVYLSIPADTAGIAFNALPDEVLQQNHKVKDKEPVTKPEKAIQKQREKRVTVNPKSSSN